MQGRETHYICSATVCYILLRSASMSFGKEFQRDRKPAVRLLVCSESCNSKGFHSDSMPPTRES